MDSPSRPTGIIAIACTALLATLLVLPLEASARIRGVRVVGEVSGGTNMGVDANGVVYVHAGQHIDRYSLRGDKLGEIPLPRDLWGGWHPDFANGVSYDTGLDGAGYFARSTGDPSTTKLYRMSPGGGGLTAIYSPEDSSKFPVRWLGDVTVGRDFVYVVETLSSGCDPLLPRDEPGNCYDNPENEYWMRAVNPLGGVAHSWKVEGDPTAVGSNRRTGEVYVGRQSADCSPTCERVDRFTAGGSRLASWAPAGGFRVWAIAVDGNGRVWVSSDEPGVDAFEAFTNTGRRIWRCIPCLTSFTPPALVAYDGRIFVPEGFGDDTPLFEMGDTPDLNVVANAKWRQEKQKVVVNTNCNTPCRTLVDTYLKIGKERVDLRLKRSETYTAKRQFFTFRLSRKFRKIVTEAHAEGKKVRVFAYVSANQVSEFEPKGVEDKDCQVVALPRARATAAAQC